MRPSASNAMRAAVPDSELPDPAGLVLERAAAFGWELMDRCRSHVGVAEQSVTVAAGHRAVWNPAAIEHGDLGVAMALTAADQLAPDAGWDRLAHHHLSRAARRFEQSGSGLGLFSGTAALAFVMRAHSRSGQRYQRAIATIDALLAERLDAATDSLAITSGLPTESYDVVSGLTGAITYTFTTDAGAGPLGRSALRALDSLAELALAERPGGLWTPRAMLNEFERTRWADRAESVLNCGFAHGICGVLNVLGQTADRGWGSSSVTEATELLADALLAAGHVDEILDVPDVIPASGTERPRARYGWCYGNLGAALPFHNSTTLRRRYPRAIADLLDTSWRGGTDLGLDGPSLCHGRAGKLVLERMLLGEHTIADNAAWLLALANPAHVFLLDDAQGIDSPGFLTGSGGAAAALLSLQLSCDAMAFTRMLTGEWV